MLRVADKAGIFGLRTWNNLFKQEMMWTEIVQHPDRHG